MSDLILNLIHSIIVIIDLIPRSREFVFLVDLPGSLGDNLHCGCCSHHHDDDVEGICCEEFRQKVDNGDDEVKLKNAQSKPVSTTSGCDSLVLLTVNI